MATNNQYVRRYSLPLQAGIPQTVEINGDFWRVDTLSAGTAITITFDDQHSFVAKAGWQGRRGFTRVTVVSTVVQTVELFLGSGDLSADTATVTISSATFTPDVLNTVQNPADVSIAAAASDLVSGGAATKRETIIKNPSSNPDSLRLGGSTVAAAAGFELEPGESIVVDGNQAIYAYNTGGAPASVSVMEVHFV